MPIKKGQKKNHTKGIGSVTAQGVTIEYSNISKLTAIARALDNGVRQKIFAFLEEKGTANVGEIMEALSMEEPPVSQHLRILRLAGLVKVSPIGKHRYYYADGVRFKQVKSAIEAVG